jgi:hypothetical protein
VAVLLRRQGGVDMKKLMLGGLALLLLGAAAVLGYVKIKTGMGPLTLWTVSRGDFKPILRYSS